MLVYSIVKVGSTDKGSKPAPTPESKKEEGKKKGK